MQSLTFNNDPNPEWRGRDTDDEFLTSGGDSDRSSEMEQQSSKCCPGSCPSRNLVAESIPPFGELQRETQTTVTSGSRYTGADRLTWNDQRGTIARTLPKIVWLSLLPLTAASMASSIQSRSVVERDLDFAPLDEQNSSSPPRKSQSPRRKVAKRDALTKSVKGRIVQGARASFSSATMHSSGSPHGARQLRPLNRASKVKCDRNAGGAHPTSASSRYRQSEMKSSLDAKRFATEALEVTDVDIEAERDELNDSDDPPSKAQTARSSGRNSTILDLTIVKVKGQEACLSWITIEGTFVKDLLDEADMLWKGSGQSSTDKIAERRAQLEELLLDIASGHRKHKAKRFSDRRYATPHQLRTKLRTLRPGLATWIVRRLLEHGSVVPDDSYADAEMERYRGLWLMIQGKKSWVTKKATDRNAAE
jgi:hypothetical protein